MAETDTENMQRSTRDQEQSRVGLESWLLSKLGADSQARVVSVSTPSENGMSSETLLFDAQWVDGETSQSGSFVARVEPDLSDVPVFPDYDLKAQYQVIDLVARNSTVRVPRLRWLEMDPQYLGARFFVMDRVDGRVPPDVMPYPMGSWLLDADLAKQRSLQDASVEILTSLHSIDINKLDTSFLDVGGAAATPLRRHFDKERNYYEWMRGARRFPVLERAFTWLEDNWPQDEGENVICWGDARIGNVIYNGFDPAAVIDWEMAFLGPREMDLCWMIFIHVFFQDITVSMEMPGMPNFMGRDEVAATYERLSGYTPKNLDFFEIYSALRHGNVMARVHERRVHFGEATWPEDPDEVIFLAPRLAQMLDGDFPS